MLQSMRRYARWLHTQWPAGTVERFPEIAEDGSTRVPGVFVTGDLGGVPLLKFSLDSGARIVERIAGELDSESRERGSDALDIVILGAGVSGMAAAVEARARGLTFEVIEASEPFSTLVNFPRGKPIYTYPAGMTPRGALQVTAQVKEALIDELVGQVERHGIRPRIGRAERIERDGGRLTVHLAGGESLRARRVVVAIGRSGNFRRLGVPGENLDKVSNRLHDPQDFAGKRVLVVGGGDSALEASIALALGGAEVTLSYRQPRFSRPKPDNLAKLEALERDPDADVAIERPSAERVGTPAGRFMGAQGPRGHVRVLLGTTVREVTPDHVVLDRGDAGPETIPNDAVFAMIGREAPLDFFRRSGVAIRGEFTTARWIGLAAFLLFCTWLYDWKSGGAFASLFQAQHWFPYNLPDLIGAFGEQARVAAADRRTLLGTLAISAAGPSFWYTLAYSTLVVVYGIKRIRRRRTPYVTAQTMTLMSIQVLPLFVIPEILLPMLEAHAMLPRAWMDALFPVVTYGHGREFWRAYGFVLAWPLNVYNIFTHEPLWTWIAIGFVQTCVLIPLGIYYFGKGVYCGWICSCGALAETLGDTQRHKMPHGPGWNRLNLAGQGVLALAMVMLVVRIVGWALPEGNGVDRMFDPWMKTPYKWMVDVFMAGIIGYGVYFWFSGRFWCRFFCPLAALMHVYARFSSFRILADKKKCISCSQCTNICHQGIDVMSFANKGLPMADPECVRCSACVQVCPTGVLQFGRINRRGDLIGVDTLMASPVRMRENP